MSKKVKPSGQQSFKLRSPRVFSDTFKRQKVKEIEAGLLKVSDISKLYNVSITSVYKWVHKYSLNNKKGVTQVVQMESEGHKTQELLKRIAELERHVGLKQLEIDYLDKLVEISSKELKIDLKKNFDTKSSSPFSKTTDKNPTK
jgi:transposase